MRDATSAHMSVQLRSIEETRKQAQDAHSLQQRPTAVRGEPARMPREKATTEAQAVA